MLKLKNWSVFCKGDKFTAPEMMTYHLQGNVYGHPRFLNGTFVTTSRITSVVDKGDYKEIITGSGSVYAVYKEDVDCGYENMYPNCYDRIKIS